MKKPSPPKFIQIIEKTQGALLPLLLPSLFFSYHPQIPILSTNNMNLELSIPIILLGIFSFLSIFTLKSSLKNLSHQINTRFTNSSNLTHIKSAPVDPKNTTHSLKKPIKNQPLKFIKNLPQKILKSCQFTKILFLLTFSLPIYLTISTLWSDNRIRGILTAGLIWGITLSILTITNFIFSQKIKTKIIKFYLIATLVICIFCWLTCILDLLGITRDLTLMCQGCTYQSFGFPHPNGFAIEPQFMGNLLLAPSFILLYLSVKNKKYLVPAIFIISTLFLTFSRGAIYSFLASLFALTLILIYKKQKFTANLLVASVAFIISLLTQGIFSELSPTTETFFSGATKSIHHLSLGIIDIRPKRSEKSITSESANLQPISEATPNQPSIKPSSPTKPTFSGYIAESTTIRLNLNNYALDLWNDSPANILFGVGLGSAGTSLYQKFNDLGTPKEIIQNQYISLLLEAGLIGIVFILITAWIIYKITTPKTVIASRSFLSQKNTTTQIFTATLAHNNTSITPIHTDAKISPVLPISNLASTYYLYALILSFALSLMFFSGLPNALHLYLVPVIIIKSVRTKH